MYNNTKFTVNIDQMVNNIEVFFFLFFSLKIYRRCCVNINLPNNIPNKFGHRSIYMRVLYNIVIHTMFSFGKSNSEPSIFFFLFFSFSVEIFRAC